MITDTPFIIPTVSDYSHSTVFVGRIAHRQADNVMYKLCINLNKYRRYCM